MIKPTRRRPKRPRNEGQDSSARPPDSRAAAPNTTGEGAPGERARPDAERTSGPTSAAPSRAVVRDESGAIVGVQRRSGPRIVGFQPVPSPGRKREVIVTAPAGRKREVVVATPPEPGPTGRASRQKQRESARVMPQKRPHKRRQRTKERSASGTAEMRPEKKVIRVDGTITTRDLAQQLGKKSGEVLRALWRLGLRDRTINSAIELEVATLVAEEFGYAARDVAVHERDILGAEEDAETGELRGRAPIVCVMGHVDHGKTTLLDRVRETELARREAGGITQGIVAYRVAAGAHGLVFLDTPGHAAFTAMRSRGVDVTDIVVLVVAADDGVMPTTVEIIERARASGVPIVVAINKVDLPGANPGRVKQELMAHRLVGEEFGGDTLIVELSAKTGVGIDALLETLALQAELMELRARVDGPATGVVLDAQIDRGLGPVATVLITAGTLRRGQVVVVAERSGKVRALHDDRGVEREEVGPSTPALLSGLDGPPAAGDRLVVAVDERAARQLVELRASQRERVAPTRAPRTLADTLRRARAKILTVVLRADTGGAAEALAHALRELSRDEVTLEVIAAGVGAITPGDVALAAVSDARILGFNTRPIGTARRDAAREGVVIHCVDIIHDALDWARGELAGQLEPVRREQVVGEAEVRALFPVQGGVVAGCRVLKGEVTRRSRIRVLRGGAQIYEGPIESLRVHKDDVARVRAGSECGVLVGGARELELGDIFQAYEVELVRQTFPPAP